MKRFSFAVIAALLVTACASAPKGEEKVFEALHEGVLDNDVTGVERIIDSTERQVIRRAINRTDSRDRTLLHIAVNNAQRSMAELLLDSGADPNGTDRNGQSPLHAAVLNQYTSLVSLLVNAGADKNLKDKRQKTPVDYAWEVNNLEILNILNPGAKPDPTPPPVAITQAPVTPPPTPALVPAAPPMGINITVTAPPVRVGAYNVAFGSSDLDIVKAVDTQNYTKTDELLRYRQNPNSVDSLNNSLLFYAVRAENDSIVQLLLSKGATVNFANNQGQTPLLFAVAKGFYGITRTLVENGASVNQPDKNGITPILLAVDTRNASLAQYLLDNGAKGTERDRDGNSLLHKAVANDDTATAVVLITAGADVRAANQRGVTVADLLRQSKNADFQRWAEAYK